MVTVLRQRTCSLPATMPGATLGTGLEGGQPRTTGSDTLLSTLHPRT